MAARVAIVDYGLCNLDSIARAIEEVGGDPVVTEQADDIIGATRVIIPGVGAFPDAMRRLRQLGLDRVLTERVRDEGIPLLGVCLGMQILAELGTEVESCHGLGWIPGSVHRFVPVAGERIPHVGWNEVHHAGHPLFEGVRPGCDFYFVHSFRFHPADPADAVATTPYCGGFPSVVARGAVVGVQFHPEKSQKAGFRVLSNFLRWDGR